MNSSRRKFLENVDKELYSAHLPDMDEEILKPLSDYEMKLSQEARLRLKERRLAQQKADN